MSGVPRCPVCSSDVSRIDSLDWRVAAPDPDTTPDIRRFAGLYSSPTQGHMPFLLLVNDMYNVNANSFFGVFTVSPKCISLVGRPPWM